MSAESQTRQYNGKYMQKRDGCGRLDISWALTSLALSSVLLWLA